MRRRMTFPIKQKQTEHHGGVWDTLITALTWALSALMDIFARHIGDSCYYTKVPPFKTGASSYKSNKEGNILLSMRHQNYCCVVAEKNSPAACLDIIRNINTTINNTFRHFTYLWRNQRDPLSHDPSDPYPQFLIQDYRFLSTFVVM